MSLAELTELPYDGVISGPFKATGTLSERNFHDIAASASVSVEPAATGMPVHGALTANFEGATETMTFGNSWLTLPGSRLDFSGTLGQRLQGRLESKDLNELRPAIAFPDTLRSGTLLFEGTLDGSLTDPRIAGPARIQNANFEGQQIDSVSGDFTGANARIALANASVSWGGLLGRGDMSLGLDHWKASDSSAISANVKIASGDLTKLLALAGWKDAPVSGTLSTTAQITGTLGDPHATGDAAVARGQVYGQPFETATAHLQYVNGGAQTATAAFNAGASRLDVTARFDHAPGAALAGKVTFNASSNTIPVNQIAQVHTREPDLRGTAREDGRSRRSDGRPGAAGAFRGNRHQWRSLRDWPRFGNAEFRRRAGFGDHQQWCSHGPA